MPSLRDIVIIGDGPSGYLMAILLHQKGVKNITLVGPRIGDFTRSGDVQGGIFSDLTAAISPLGPIKPSRGFHLKDIERQLHAIANTLGISLLKRKFENFAPGNNIILSDADGTSQIHADIVFDCTGTKRIVINKFNDRPEKGERFKIEKCSTQFHNSYALVRAVTSDYHSEGLVEITIKGNLRPEPIAYILTIEKLRQLGWKSYHLPPVYANAFQCKSQRKQVKINIYSAVPDDIKKENIPEFVETLFTLLTFDQYKDPYQYKLRLHKHSSKHPQKQMVSKFHIDPHQIKSGCFKGDKHYPVIFHAGDASADLPFKTGQSISIGIERMRAMIGSFSFADGAITKIDYKRFKAIYSQALTKHSAMIESAIEIDKKCVKRQSLDLDNNYLNLHFYYLRAVRSVQNLKQEVIIKTWIHNLRRSHALKISNDAKSVLTGISHPKAGLNIRTSDLDAKLEDILQKCAETFKLATYLTTDDKVEINNTLHDTALRCAKLAYTLNTSNRNLLGLFKGQSRSLIEKFYNISLKIYGEFLIGKFPQAEIAIYSQLIKLANKAKDFDLSISLFEKLELLGLLTPSADKKLILDKITLQASFASQKINNETTGCLPRMV